MSPSFPLLFLVLNPRLSTWGAGAVTDYIQRTWRLFNGNAHIVANIVSIHGATLTVPPGQ